MKVIISIYALVISFFGINVYSQTPTFQALFQNTSGTQQNEIFSVVNDDNGNTFFCGSHSDSLKFGAASLLPNQGGAFWGKADPSGNIVWLRQGGTSMPTADKALRIAVDQNGDVYVCGSIAGNLVASFNNIPLPSQFIGFVTKYSNSGNFIWATGISRNVYGIAIDNANTPIINSGDAAIYKLNPTSGAEIETPSANLTGSLMNPALHNIVVDESNNIIVQAGNKIIKFDNNFNQIWSTPVSTGIVETFQINLDQAGNVYGTFYALFGTVSVGNVSKSNFPNGYIYKLDASTGNPIFVDSLLIGGNASKIKEIIPKDGNYYISGDGAFNTPVVLKVSPTYSVIWQKNLVGNTAVNDIQYLSEDCIQIGGKHSQNVTLDGYNLTVPNGTSNTANSFYASLCTGNVGLSEQIEPNSLSFFPNPCAEKSVIETPYQLKNATLAIYNLYGQQVELIKQISGPTFTLYRNNLPNGLYMVSLTEDNKIIAAGKLVFAN